MIFRGGVCLIVPNVNAIVNKSTVISAASSIRPTARIAASFAESLSVDIGINEVVSTLS